MDKERYSRQILFTPIGESGQKKLMNKHVLIIGAGALGSACAEMITRAGIGTITIIDRDYVESSNLQRQQLYTEEDAKTKMPKAAAAKKRLQAINSHCTIHALVAEASVEVLEHIIGNIDVILDCTDNFETRMIINDLSQKFKVPWIYGACVGSVGMSYTIIPEETPCLHCLLKRMPLQNMTCDTNGIIAPAVQMVVTHQVVEAIKLLVEDKNAQRGTLLSFDLWNNQYSTIKVAKAKTADCLSCGENRTYPFLELENQTKTAVLCGRDTVQIRPPKERKIDFSILVEKLTQLGYEVSYNTFLLSIAFEQERMVLFTDGRALIHGTKDIVAAKALYNRILG